MAKCSRTAFIPVLAATTALCSVLAAAPAAAQAIGEVPPPPERSSVDENGVDVMTLQPSFSDTDISVGPSGPGGRIFTRQDGIGGNNSEYASIHYFGGGVTVVLGGNTEMFFLQMDGSFATNIGTGTTLVRASPSSTTFTYTSRDGTVAVFENVGFSHPNGPPVGQLTSITYPDGVKAVMTLKTLYGAARVSSTMTNQGYMLKFHYANDATVSAEWGRIVSVTAINLGTDYCDPAANTCALSGAMRRATYTETWTGSETVRTVTDPVGRTTTYARSNSALRIRRPGSSSDNVVYNFTGGLVSSVVRDGVTHSYSYSDGAGGRTTTVTDPNGNTRVYVGNVTTNLVSSVRDELYRTTAYVYDAQGRTTQITYPEGNKALYTYDARGNVLEFRQVSKTPGTPTDIVVTANYDATCANIKTCNKPNWTIDARGNRTDYTYDATHGGVLTVTAPAATVGGVRPQTRYSYAQQQAYYKNASGSIVASGQPIYVLTGVSTCQTAASCAGTGDEVKTTLDYGPQVAGTANNLLPVSTSSGAGNGALTATTAVTYDAAGNRSTVDGPLSGTADTSRTLYNANREVVGAIGPDPDGGGARLNRAQRITYGADGQVTKVESGITAGQSDGNWAAFAPSQQVVTSYDGNGRKATDTVQTAGGTSHSLVQYSYDALGRADCVTVRMNPATYGSLPGACTAATAGSNGPDRIVKQGYDAASQPTSVIEGYGQAAQATERTLTYTSNGKVQTVTDAESNKTTFEYDGFDRLAKTVYPSTSKGAGASNSGDYEQLTYDAGGNVTSRRLRDGNSIGYSYDYLNRLTTKDLPSPEYDTTHSYDLLGRLTGASRGDGQALSFAYDALGRNTSTSSNYGGTTSYAYDVAGRRTRMTWADSFYVDYDYLVTGEMTAIREYGAGSGAGVLASYGYDDLGRRTSLTRGNGTVTSYGYDAVSRLGSLSHDLAGSSYDLTHTFSYSPASQIASLTRSNTAYAFSGYANVDRGYTSNGLNQYTVSGGVSLGYDARGNLTTSGGSSYGYTVENMLKTAPGGVTLAYDPAGRLIQTVGAAETRFAYDGSDLIAEYNSSNSLLRRYVHGPGADEPLVWYEGSGTSDRRWLHADERGSVIAATDGSGAVISGGIYTYDEYGIPGSSYASRFQYTGQAWIPEIGMYHYKARAYSPTLGRFMQTDPIGYGDGMNMYAYVKNDPVNGRDPSGLFADSNDMRPQFNSAYADVTVTGYRDISCDDIMARVMGLCASNAVAQDTAYQTQPTAAPAVGAGTPQNMGSSSVVKKAAAKNPSDALKKMREACGKDQKSAACAAAKAEYMAQFKEYQKENPLPEATGPDSPSIFEGAKKYFIDAAGCAAGVTGVGAVFKSVLGFVSGVLVADSCINTIKNGLGK